MFMFSIGMLFNAHAYEQLQHMWTSLFLNDISLSFQMYVLLILILVHCFIRTRGW